MAGAVGVAGALHGIDEAIARHAARTLAGSDTTDRATVTITLGTVGLSRLTYRATVGGRPVRVELDYTAVGAAPRVTVPV